MLSLTRDDLMHIAPRPKTAAGAVWDAYCNALTSPEASALFQRYGITTPLRAQHLLATMCGETNFSIIWESGAYSAAGILRVFGEGHHSARVTETEAAHIASLAVRPDGSGPRCDALFNRVYGIENPHCCGNTHACVYPKMICKARELGNDDHGDGSAHRGLGLAQDTGKASQGAHAQKIGVPLASLPQPLNLIHVALCEWQEKNCNRYADEDDAVSIRKLINGGSLKVPVSRLNGLPEVMAALKRAKNVITDADFVSGEVAASEPDMPETHTLTPNNDDQPDSLLMSREVHAAGGQILGGSGLSMHSSIMAFTSTMSEGRFSFLSFLLHLSQDPEFVGGIVFIALGVAQFVWRRSRYYIHGV